MLFIPIVGIFQTAYVQSNLTRAWERAADGGAADRARLTASARNAHCTGT